MNNTKKNRVGRPTEKQDRVKIGLSIDGETSKLLSFLAEESGKTKSKIFEEAIKVLEAREALVRSRMQTLEELGDEALLDFDEFVKKQRSY